MTWDTGNLVLGVIWHISKGKSMCWSINIPLAASDELARVLLAGQLWQLLATGGLSNLHGFLGTLCSTARSVQLAGVGGVSAPLQQQGYRGAASEPGRERDVAPSRG